MRFKAAYYDIQRVFYSNRFESAFHGPRTSFIVLVVAAGYKPDDVDDDDNDDNENDDSAQ